MAGEQRFFFPEANEYSHEDKIKNRFKEIQNIKNELVSLENKRDILFVKIGSERNSALTQEYAELGILLERKKRELFLAEEKDFDERLSERFIRGNEVDVVRNNEQKTRERWIVTYFVKFCDEKTLTSRYIVWDKENENSKKLSRFGLENIQSTIPFFVGDEFLLKDPNGEVIGSQKIISIEEGKFKVSIFYFDSSKKSENKDLSLQEIEELYEDEIAEQKKREESFKESIKCSEVFKKQLDKN